MADLVSDENVQIHLSRSDSTVFNSLLKYTFFKWHFQLSGQAHVELFSSFLHNVLV